MSRPLPWSRDRHDWFFSDSYRTAANIGLDYEWFGIDIGQCDAAANIQKFLLPALRTGEFYIYEIDGTIAVKELCLHPVGLQVTVAQSVLAATTEASREWVESFFKMPLREGKRRYYDNCLYFFAYLALSGNYRMW